MQGGLEVTKKAKKGKGAEAAPAPAEDTKPQDRCARRTMGTLCHLTTLSMQLQPGFHCSSPSTLDAGSGWEIPAICHGAAFGMVILPQNCSTGNVKIPGWRCILSAAKDFIPRKEYVTSHHSNVHS